MNGNIYLSTSSLNVGYIHNHDRNLLFENLNLSLYGGQLVCFMGPNGIGKSSLIRTLAGLQKPLGGKMETPSGRDNKNLSREIAVVLTDRVSAVNMTVYEIVAFGRYPYLDWNVRLKEADNRIIQNAIDRVHIGYLASKKLHTLSDGQLQMTMIARALAQDTPVVMLDEPTAHLDLNNRVEIMKLLRSLSHTTNKAILVATHELDLALQLADRIWLTDRHKNILTGSPEDLVLDGSFDAIFQLKGFDLKTGKIEHEAYKGLSIQLTGAGHEYLWTKNALERNGFTVTDEPGDIGVFIFHDAHKHVRWKLTKPGYEKNFNALADLILSV